MLFGGYTWLAGSCRLTILTRRSAQARTMREKGFSLRLPDGDVLEAKPHVLASQEGDFLSSQPDLILVTVKQTQLKPVLEWIKSHIAASRPLLFIMNGLGHHEHIERTLPHRQVYYGVTQCGATKIGDTAAEVRGKGVTMIGTPYGCESEPSVALSQWMKHITPYLAIEWSDRIEQAMWKKAVINACINPLTALFQVPNGELVKRSSLTKLMRQLYAELVPLVETVWEQENNFILAGGGLWEEIVAVCTKTASNHSSMWQDIQRGRRTEIEALNGYFVTKAVRYNMDLPVHRFISQAIHVLEEKNKQL